MGPELSTREQILLAIEDEHEPLDVGDSATWMHGIAVALVSGRVLVGYTRRGQLVAAYPTGTVTIAGAPVFFSLNHRADDLNPRYCELNQALSGRRGRLWAPTVRIPGDTFDVAYVFYALIGWQTADMIAAEAMGCSLCAGSTVHEVDTAGPGRVFVACDCQEIHRVDDDVPEPEWVPAHEEEGAWYTGADLLGEAA